MSIIPSCTETLLAIWQAGPSFQLRHHCARCVSYRAVDVDALAQDYGWDFTLWDYQPPCDTCGDLTFYLWSAGPSTRLLPMKTEAGRRDALRLQIEHGRKYGWLDGDYRKA